MRATSAAHDLASGAVKFAYQSEWTPEGLAAYELAHLGFYTSSPMEVEEYGERLTQEFSVTKHCRAGGLSGQGTGQH